MIFTFSCCKDTKISLKTIKYDGNITKKQPKKLYLCTKFNKCTYNKQSIMDMKQVVNTKAAPAAIGPYSQAIQVGNLVYTSGQIPIDPATGSFVEGGIKEQTRQSLNNVKAILHEAGLSMGNVIKTTVFMADMTDFVAMNEVYAEFFAEPYPARSAVAVKTLPKGALVEIEVIAANE